MRVIAIAAFAAAFGLKLPASAEGLNLDRPTFIDAAAYILYSSLQDYQIDRKSDDLVIISFTPDMPLELRKSPGRKCGLQSFNLKKSEKAYNQFNFDKYSGEYIATPMGDYFKTRYRLLGFGLYCERWNGEVECRNSYDVEAYGVRGNQNMIRALSFVATQCR